MDNQAGRVPPRDVDAEVATLGAIMLDPGEAIYPIIELLRPRNFYKSAHINIFQSIINLFERNEEIDQITVTDELRRLELLKNSGGVSYIASLTTAVPTAANVRFYANIVKEYSVRRQLAQIGNQISVEAHEEGRSSRQVLEKAEQLLFEIHDENRNAAVIPVKEVVNTTIEAIERLKESPDSDAYGGIPTGYSDLDHMLDGLHKSEFIVVGARPSVGKTAFALNIAANMAIRSRKKVGFFTLEMSHMALMQRLLSSEAEIPSEKIRVGRLSTEQFNRLIDVASLFYETDLWIVDTPNMGMLDLRSQARRLVSRQEVEILFVDYLSLITSESLDTPRHEQIAEISRSLKSMARELDIPIVALSQLTRDAEGTRPTLAKIRESGAIEQDADVVIFLHRGNPNKDINETASHNSMVDVEVIIAKQRNGPTGAIPMVFSPGITKFQQKANVPL